MVFPPLIPAKAGIQLRRVAAEWRGQGVIVLDPGFRRDERMVVRDTSI